ncbi:hypothetical protein Tco_0294312 [Tanacetum coccineum]
MLVHLFMNGTFFSSITYRHQASPQLHDPSGPRDVVFFLCKNSELSLVQTSYLQQTSQQNISSNLTTKMTTSSANNVVFKKQKLTGPNFIDWYRQLRIVLSIEDKLNYLEQPLPQLLLESLQLIMRGLKDQKRLLDSCS